MSNDHDVVSTPSIATNADGTLKDIVPKLSKTPLFQAVHAARYQRQALIREIQQLTDSKLICYIAGVSAPVDREDVVCFVDMLHNISCGQNIDLLLHTGGGDIDAADKLITMVRKKVGTGRLRVIVPDYAKSAGTLMALGADSIVMSDTSELGPIDPQVIRSDRNGNRVRHSVKNYLDAYEDHRKALQKNPDDATARLMLDKLDPETVRLYTSIMTRARELAENKLKVGMMQHNGGNWTQAASALLDTTRFQTHGQPISWEDASDRTIGLTVEYLDPNDELWLKIWQLYCLQIISVKEVQKLFESDVASLCIDSRAI
ncbi:SDH family Clp fold serine proteinase [Nocardia alni]|uniref:SDH family Clp fold serine proteinase n=1 Tax=Nocardia alni TaxID=2815723 RepID=UPI001C22B69F|nr:hypothetical protein [Nocardia alni]